MIYPREYTGTVPSTKAAAAARQAVELCPIVRRLAPASVLDIGCGFGFIDVHLAGASGSIRTVHLVDGDGTGEQRGGFRDHMRAWSNVDVAAAIVRANLPGPPDVTVHAYQAATVLAETVDAHSQLRDVDLVVSCRAWGHHFPIDHYGDLVRRVTRPGAHVITDIRNGTGGIRHLQNFGFDVIEQIPDPSVKCGRFLFRKAV